MVNRALSFATSDPKGPVYLCAAREPLEEDIEPYQLEQNYWSPVEPSALPLSGVKTIAEALVNAQEPLIIAGFTGRNHGTVRELVQLADHIKGLRVLDTGGSDMCFPGTFVSCSDEFGRLLTDSSEPPGLAGPPIW
jgi:thiamine pyrophosphate-dependent acetolactate synthase large subunit-like protein